MDRLQTGAPGAPGFSYTLNIKGGTRGVATQQMEQTRT